MVTSEVNYNCEHEGIEDRSEEESEEGSEQLEDNGCSEELDVGSQERLLHREVRSVHFITYSQAYLDNFRRETVLLDRLWKHSMRQGAG